MSACKVAAPTTSLSRSIILDLKHWEGSASPRVRTSRPSAAKRTAPRWDPTAAPLGKAVFAQRRKEHKQWRLQRLGDKLHFQDILATEDPTAVSPHLQATWDQLTLKCKRTEWRPFVKEDLESVMVKWKNNKLR